MLAKLRLHTALGSQAKAVSSLQARTVRHLTPATMAALGKDQAAAQESVESQTSGGPTKGSQASKAQSAADKSANVVEQIIHDPPITKDEAAVAESVQSDATGGQVVGGTRISQMQSAADKLEQVALDKLASGEPITQDDANRISSAESKITGERMKGGLSAQAQSAADKAKQAGLT